MGDNLAAKEVAAVSLLTRAVELDTKKRKTEALVCYKEGLQIFMEVIRGKIFFVRLKPNMSKYSYLFCCCSNFENSMFVSLANISFLNVCI